MLSVEDVVMPMTLACSCLFLCASWHSDSSCALSASALALLALSWASACKEQLYSCSVAFSKSFRAAWHPCCLSNCSLCLVKQCLGIEPAVGVVDNPFPRDALTDVYAGVDVGHELLCQSTGVAENTAIQPWPGQVGPELQQVCHPLPRSHGVQPDILVPYMYALPGQVCAGGKVLGNSDESGEPLREDGDGISSSIMEIHSPPFQGGQDVGSINGGVVPKHLEASDYLVHRP